MVDRAAARQRWHLTVLAKVPVAGQVKTRLCPPLTHSEAAAVALDCLLDTLDAARACRADEVVLSLDGDVGDRFGADLRVVAQGTGSLAERLHTTWHATGAPGLQIGMDTPQVSAALLDEAFDRLSAPGVDAVLGPATDGGWWAIGLQAPCPGIFDGVPMGRHDTGERQLARLRHLGLRVATLPVLRDVDDWTDALAVADEAPTGRFARCVGRLRSLDPIRERDPWEGATESAGFSRGGSIAAPRNPNNPEEYP